MMLLLGPEHNTKRGLVFSLQKESPHLSKKKIRSCESVEIWSCVTRSYPSAPTIQLFQEINKEYILKWVSQLFKKKKRTNFQA